MAAMVFILGGRFYGRTGIHSRRTLKDKNDERIINVKTVSKR